MGLPHAEQWAYNGRKMEMARPLSRCQGKPRWCAASKEGVGPESAECLNMTRALRKDPEDNHCDDPRCHPCKYRQIESRMETGEWGRVTY